MEQKKKGGYFWIVLSIIMGILEVINGIHDAKLKHEERKELINKNEEAK